MTAILSIIAIVAAVSLYDYFQSRSWQRITSNIRNEVVFENRNKKYGAFVIRRDYEKTMILIIGSLFLGGGLLYAAYAGFRTPPIEKMFQPPVIIEQEIELVLSPKPTAEVELPKQNKVASTSKVVKFPEPEITDKKVKSDVKTEEELKNAKIGVSDIEKKGDGGGSELKKEEEKKKEIIPVKPTGPIDIVDVSAEYPGGYPAMMKFIQENLIYPEIGIENGAQGKCYLRFVVDDKGKISSVKVMRGIAGCPECDQEAMRVIRKMPKWKPGKLQGEDVSSYFDLPINFKLE